jgi:hypothetical protein
MQMNVHNSIKNAFNRFSDATDAENVAARTKPRYYKSVNTFPPGDATPIFRVTG